MADPVFVEVEHTLEGWDAPVNDNFEKVDDNFMRKTKSADHGQTSFFDHAMTLSGVLAGATVTLAGAIPAGCLLMGVSARVKDVIPGGGGTTDFDIGDGVTVNLFADAVALAAGTDTDFADHLASFTPTIYKVAGDIVLTANGAVFSGGKVRVVAHYMKITPPTS